MSTTYEGHAQTVTVVAAFAGCNEEDIGMIDVDIDSVTVVVVVGTSDSNTFHSDEDDEDELALASNAADATFAFGSTAADY